MDRIIRATAADDFIKMAVIDGRSTVQRAREIHNCTPTASACLGRTLCAASLIGNMMKEEKGSLTIRIGGGGPAGSVVAVSDSQGNVRGYMDNPRVDLPLREDGKLNVGGAIGRDGMLTVSRDLGLKEPYIGSTALVSGEIAEDVTNYLLESEQVPSACGLGVLVDTDTSIKAAGGFIVQLMPGADEKLIDMLEDNIFMMDQLTTILAEDGAEALFDQVLKGVSYQIVSQEPVEYRCGCSRERLHQVLSCIDQGELKDMVAQGQDIHIRCDFCGTEYDFAPAELQTMIHEAE
jgi:molecular chaperone Hsp33